MAMVSTVQWVGALILQHDIYNDNGMVEKGSWGNNDAQHGKGMVVISEGVLELIKVRILFLGLNIFKVRRKWLNFVLNPY